MESVLITVAHFTRLLEEAKVAIDNPAELIAPEKHDRSYRSDLAKGVWLMLSETKSGGKTFQVNLTMQYEKNEYVVVVNHRAQEVLHRHNVFVNQKLL